MSTKKGGRRAPHSNPVKLAVPGEDDILCGKDRACALHKGSLSFRAVIDSYRATYQKATTKYDKMCLTKQIYQELTQKSKFLKFNDKEKVWEEISPLAGRDKIGHALRFANNHLSSNKGKKSRKATPKRQGSFSSSSATSGTTATTAPTPSKAELVASLVEVAKDEPKVWDSLVDHLTHDALATVPVTTGSGAEMASDTHNQRVVCIVDPVALENIAYAVESNTDDAALDDLVALLNNDDIVTEEAIQDVLTMAAMESSNNTPDEIPPTVTINVSPGSMNQTEVTAAFATLLVDSNSAFAESSTSAMHHFSMDDDMWSIMKEPILEDLDWQ